MNILDVSQILHIVGIAWGVGGATAITLINMQADKKPELSPLRIKLMPVFSKLIGVGMLLLIISGIILKQELSEARVDKEIFPIKMLLVLVLIVNGIYMSFRVIPKMTILAPTDGKPSAEFLKIKQQAKNSGLIGLVLWYAIVVLGVLL